MSATETAQCVWKMKIDLLNINGKWKIISLILISWIFFSENYSSDRVVVMDFQSIRQYKIIFLKNCKLLLYWLRWNTLTYGFRWTFFWKKNNLCATRGKENNKEKRKKCKNREIQYDSIVLWDFRWSIKNFNNHT